jgi:hypothetical protein
MTIETLTQFFMWTTILNMGFLIYAFVLLAFTGDFVYRIHNKWFPMPRDSFNVVVYSFIGFYKLLVLILCVIPWIALAIIG